MLKKRKCSKCGKKIFDSYRFCPHCGYGDRNFEDFGNDWGMLGKDDLSENAFQLPFGFDNLVNSLMKNLTKQLNESYENPKKSDSTARSNGISISISSSGNSPPKIQINSPSERKVRKVLPGQFSEEDAKRFSQLKKEEPKTNIRRLSNKVVYEIEFAGVKSLKDISIIKLENSIEIKAIGKNKAYIKRIPINMPIINYTFSSEKLVLEFAVKE